MKWGGLALGFLVGCVTAPGPTPIRLAPAPVVATPAAEDLGRPVREVLAAFLLATEARRFEQVRALLSRPLRQRYPVERLERDFGAEPRAAERLAQIQKCAAPLLVSPESASLEWAPGRSLRLVREPEGWRIAALE